MDRFFIIDGHSQIYRAIHARMADLESPEGEPTKGTYVFCRTFLRLLRDESPEFLAMAVDGPRHKLRRRARYPEYKATREDPDEGVMQQVSRIRQIVRALGVQVLEAEGYEADDVIAALVAALDGCDDLEIVIVSRDKDLMQLIRPGVVMYDPTEDVEFDERAVVKKFGVRPEQMIEYQTLVGDPGDNVPGVRGIGPRRAVELLTKYGSIANILDNLDTLTPKLAEALDDPEQIELCRYLVTLDRDAPIDCDPEGFEWLGVSRKSRHAAAKLFAELGFNSWAEWWR